jgi:hypothetical protein
VQGDLEDAETEERAQPDRGERDPDLLEKILLRHRRDLAPRPTLDHLHQHRGGSLADRAAPAAEPDVRDRLAVAVEGDRDLVAAERVLPLRLGVGALDHP